MIQRRLSSLGLAARSCGRALLPPGWISFVCDYPHILCFCQCSVRSVNTSECKQQQDTQQGVGLQVNPASSALCEKIQGRGNELDQPWPRGNWTETQNHVPSPRVRAYIFLDIVNQLLYSSVWNKANTARQTHTLNWPFAFALQFQR